jgi:hypothetical protein
MSSRTLAKNTHLTNKTDLETRGIKGSQPRSYVVASVTQLQQISGRSSNCSRAKRRGSGCGVPDLSGPLDSPGYA